MNKKAKLYSNNRSFGFRKVKDNQIQSNQKSLLSKSTEKRKKPNFSIEQNLDKSQKVKIAPYKSKKVRIQSNNNRYENTLNGKEYTNILNEKESEEEEIISQRNQQKNDKFDYRNNEKEKIKSNKYNINLAKKEKSSQKKNKKEEEDSSEEENNDNDLLYRTLYRTSNKNLEKIKEKEEKIKKNNEKNIGAKYKSNNNNNDNYLEKENKNNDFISMEQTDNLTYNNDDKKIYLNAYNNKIKIQKNSSREPNSKRDSNKYFDKDNYNDYKSYSQKRYEKRNIDISYNYITQKTINLYVIDDDFDTKVYSKLNKKINRKNNKFREIFIEKIEPNMPPKNEKFTGFIFIRKSKGKKMYTLELPDDIEQINTILKNEDIMIKNQVIQIIPLNSLNETKKSLNEKNLEKEIDKLKETIKDKERQITILKNKNEDLNNTIKKQTKQITQNEKDISHHKVLHEQLQDSYQTLDNENKSLKAQLQAFKLRRKSIQMQMEEETNQRNIQEMKDRIQKYKNDLRRTSSLHENSGTRKSGFDSPSIKKIQENVIIKKDSVHIVENIKKEEHDKDKDKDKEIKEQKMKNNEEEENYQDDYNYDIYDENDPKARKMKKAVARFRKKYKDVIIENKKNLKLKEKEEREKEENERKELEGINYQETEEKERKEKEERERREKERKEREEKERKEKERREKEKREREKKEREEKERREKERKEKEEKERKERERKEKERKEKEERERKEKEKKEKERKEKEEREKKEKDKEKEKEKEKKQVIPNKLNMGNFSKMLADKMKIAPMGAGMRKTSGNEYISKLPILEKKVDVVNLIEGQPFKRKNKRKPTRKKFDD